MSAFASLCLTPFAFALLMLVIVKWRINQGQEWAMKRIQSVKDGPEHPPHDEPVDVYAPCAEHEVPPGGERCWKCGEETA